MGLLKDYPSGPALDTLRAMTNYPIHPMTVQVASCGWNYDNDGGWAAIRVNELSLNIPKNENQNYRGLHLAVVDPKTSKAIIKECFDTYSSSTKLEEFIASDLVPDGFIVAAACRDDCVKSLSETTKKWFESMGSDIISDLKYREGFSFIGVKGQQIALEKKPVEMKGIAQVTQIFALGDNE